MMQGGGQSHVAASYPPQWFLRGRDDHEIPTCTCAGQSEPRMIYTREKRQQRCTKVAATSSNLVKFLGIGRSVSHMPFH